MSGEGRFILINGILCRTADATGSFRPADIFSGYNPTCFVKEPQSQSVADTLAANLTQDEIKEQAMPTINSNCPIYEHFSVLSGGVLIDPRHNSFLDFTDTCTYAPLCSDKDVKGPQEQKRKKRKKEKRKKKSANCGQRETVPVRWKRVHKRIEHNLSLYKQGCLDGIKAEAVLSLVSSLEPVGTKGSADTPLMEPNTYPQFPRSDKVDRIAQHNMRYMRRCSVLSLRPQSRVERKRLLLNLKTTEFFRLLNKAADTFYGVIPATAPFHFQANGMRFLPSPESALLMGNHNHNDSEKRVLENEWLRRPLSDDDNDDDNATNNSDARHSFSSAFIPVGVNCRGGPITSFHYRLLQRLSKRVRSIKRVKRHDLHTLYKPLHPWAVLHRRDVQLLPPQHYMLTPIRQLEWVFNNYFHVLGIKESVTKGRRRYSLSPDADFSAEDAVAIAIGKKSLDALSQDKIDAIQTTASREQLSSAWLALFAQSQQQIVQRLKFILAKISELSK